MAKALLLFISLVSTSSSARYCENIINDEQIYIALSSEERSYYKEDQDYKDYKAALIEQRANALCAFYNCGEYQSFEIDEIALPGLCNAVVAHDNSMSEDSFELVRLSKLTDEGHKKLGNALWYIGHTLTCCTIVGVLNYWPYFEGVMTFIPPIFVIASQAITMASRAIERSEAKEISFAEADERKRHHKKVNTVRVRGPARPHQRFTRIKCNSWAGGYQGRPDDV